ncbi:hypothetical protein E4U16_007985 [Claviceps sp. LM84 group G4]|nr:hypothetical protein E4U16_007985 [Claviceps sp. LM84 group G4]KAG6086320.1 hypothetical protein E4U33_006139 [Claviceps sp. LM78 group G4]
MTADRWLKVERPATTRPSDDEAMELVDNCDEGGWAIGRLKKLEQADEADGASVPERRILLL